MIRLYRQLGVVDAAPDRSVVAAIRPARTLPCFQDVLGGAEWRTIRPA
ncbi:MAG: hypothetical protein AAFU59_13860 [Pseudomonadota bacterium]